MRGERVFVAFCHGEIEPGLLRYTVFKDHVYDQRDDAQAALLLLELEHDAGVRSGQQPGQFGEHRTQIVQLRFG